MAITFNPLPEKRGVKGEAKMKKTIICFILALLLEGCVIHDQWKKSDGTAWDKDSLAQFRRDDYECNKEAKQYTSQWDLLYQVDLVRWYRKCLYSRGYEIIENPKKAYAKDNTKTNPLSASEGNEIIKNPKQIFWKKSDGTSWDAASLKQLKEDSYECQKDTTRSFVNCMTSKGYEIVENPKYIMKGNEKIKNPDYIAK